MRSKRTIVIILSVLIISASLLSPAVEISDGHDHSCSPNRCLICFVSGALHMLQNLIITAAVFPVPFFIIILLYSLVRFLPIARTVSTPIRLKTKILS